MNKSTVLIVAITAMVGVVSAKPSSNQCAFSRSFAFCFIDPCNKIINPGCVQHPTAQCNSNYCDFCDSYFTTAPNYKIPDQACECQVEDYVQCLVDPCSTTTCNAESAEIKDKAFCESNYCSGCGYKWYAQGGDGQFYDVTADCDLPATA